MSVKISYVPFPPGEYEQLVSLLARVILRILEKRAAEAEQAKQLAEMSE